jgi:hypothetical protein
VPREEEECHITHPPRGLQKVAIAKTGRVNYTTMEDIPEGKQVLTGTFSLNGQPVVILFDSCATHDFISRYWLPLWQRCQKCLLTFLMQLRKRTELSM